MEGSDTNKTTTSDTSTDLKKRKLHNNNNISSQRDALIVIFHSLGGPAWTRHDKWLSDDDDDDDSGLEHWQGVTCSSSKDGKNNNNNNNVTVIELSQNNLVGRLDDPILIDAFVRLAPTLEQLWLSENKLTGNLPPIFADASVFPRLTILDVGSNQLRGALHPSFAATSFSWFDTSGNELTSYFRYSTSTATHHKDHDDGNAEDNAILVKDMIVNESSTSTLPPHVHAVPSLLTKQQCTTLIDLAIHHTNTNGCGWQTDRHKAYQTTDIDIAVCGGDLLEACNSHLQHKILPHMSRLFGFELVDISVEDLFLAKYSAAKDSQSMLSEHRDDSELSFVLALNDGFEGGGTRFVAEDQTVRTNTGGCVLFCGRRLHSGAEVIEGVRYILAGFVRVYPSTPQGCVTLDRLLKDIV